MKPGQILVSIAALSIFVAGCSTEELIGTASRTVRNICANAPNCTVYDDDGTTKKEWKSQIRQR